MKKTFLLFIVLASLNAWASDRTVRVRGRLIDRPDTEFLLFKECNYRDTVLAGIRTVGREFDFTIKNNDIEYYELVPADQFRAGTFVPIGFFTDTPLIDISIYPDTVLRVNRFFVAGANVNRGHRLYMKEEYKLFGRPTDVLLDSLTWLFDNDRYNSEEARFLLAAMADLEFEDITDRQKHGRIKALEERLEELKDYGQDRSPEAHFLTWKIDSLHHARFRWRYDRINAQPDLLSFFMLARDMERDTEFVDAARAVQAYTKLSERYPEHPYTTALAPVISGLARRVPGELFYDFYAYDTSGKQYRLADLANGKLTVLNLWGSWSKSCRISNQGLIDIYKNNRNRNFTVVGVAREFGNTDGMKKIMSEDGHSWVDLVELDDKGRIWEQYGVPNGRGARYVIDPGGTIVAVDPTDEELLRLIDKYCR